MYTRSAMVKLVAGLGELFEGQELSDIYHALETLGIALLSPHDAALAYVAMNMGEGQTFYQKKIAAIKYYREQTGFGLKDSKEAIDSIWDPAR